MTDAVRASYDAVAEAYDAAIGDELAGKALDRALLDAVAELAAGGRLADVGCGPGHVTRYLAERHPDVLGLDLSPAMVQLAREHAPELTFEVASMLDLPVADGAWAGIVAFYSVIHLSAAERAAAFDEFTRVLRPAGWLLLALHVDSPDFGAGDVNRLTTWFGSPVRLSGYFLDPAEVTAELVTARLTVAATTVREPVPDVEYPSRRCYLLATR